MSLANYSMVIEQLNFKKVKTETCFCFNRNMLKQKFPASFSISQFFTAAFIRGRHLIEGGVYSNKYGAGGSLDSNPEGMEGDLQWEF